jgi:hypothetical protein
MASSRVVATTLVTVMTFAEVCKAYHQRWKTEDDSKLTRKESHMVLELLAQKASSASWLDAVQWPGWLIRKA